MDNPAVPAILDESMWMHIEDLMTDSSLACLDVGAAVAAEATALLRADRHHQPVAGQLADLLEGSVLGERCLLNLRQCDAAALLFGEIAETALPDAVRAGQLAEVFRARYNAES